MHKLDGVNATQLRDDIPAFRAGDTLKVHVKVVEGTRSRIQVFQGIVIARQGTGVAATVDLDLVDGRCVQGEHALHSHTKGNLADREGRADAGSLAGDLTAMAHLDA